MRGDFRSVKMIRRRIWRWNDFSNASQRARTSCMSVDTGSTRNFSDVLVWTAAMFDELNDAQIAKSSVREPRSCQWPSKSLYAHEPTFTLKIGLIEANVYSLGSWASLISTGRGNSSRRFSRVCNLCIFFEPRCPIGMRRTSSVDEQGM